MACCKKKKEGKKMQTEKYSTFFATFVGSRGRVKFRTLSEN